MWPCVRRWWLPEMALDGLQFWRWLSTHIGHTYVEYQTTSSQWFRTFAELTNETKYHDTVRSPTAEYQLQSQSNFCFPFRYSVTIYSLNEQRQVLHSQTTGILSIQLDRNEESRLIYLDTELKYPVLISVNLLVTTPNKLPQPPPTPVPESVTTTPDESVVQSNDAEISTIGVTKAIATNNNNNDDDYNANRSNDSTLWISKSLTSIRHFILEFYSIKQRTESHSQTHATN